MDSVNTMVKSVGVRTTIAKRKEALIYKGFQRLSVYQPDGLNMTLCAAKSYLVRYNIFVATIGLNLPIKHWLCNVITRLRELNRARKYSYQWLLKRHELCPDQNYLLSQKRP